MDQHSQADLSCERAESGIEAAWFFAKRPRCGFQVGRARINANGSAKAHGSGGAREGANEWRGGATTCDFRIVRRLVTRRYTTRDYSSFRDERHARISHW